MTVKCQRIFDMDLMFTRADQKRRAWADDNFGVTMGFTLQVNINSLGTLNWSNVVTLQSDDGTNQSCVVNPPAGNRFYRLFKS
jgi:hypothetical protein